MKISYFDEGVDFDAAEMDEPLNEEAGAGDDEDHFGDNEVVHSSADGNIPMNMDTSGKANSERITTPYMTKYEKARILGTRALQIRYWPKRYLFSCGGTYQMALLRTGVYPNSLSRIKRPRSVCPSFFHYFLILYVLTNIRILFACRPIPAHVHLGGNPCRCDV